MQRLIIVDAKSPLHRHYYQRESFYLKGVSPYDHHSVQEVFSSIFLEKHDCKGAAGTLTAKRKLLKSPDNIESWSYVQIGKDNIRHSGMLQAKEIFHVILLGLMQHGDNEFCYEMTHYLHKYRPDEVQFFCSSRYDFVWGCGQCVPQLKEGSKKPLGMNLYGKLLYQIFYECYNHVEFHSKLSGLAGGPCFKRNRASKFALIIGDSELHQLDEMVCGDIIKVSGGKYHDLVIECEFQGKKPENYEVVVFLCGFNVAKNPDEEYWETSFGSLRKLIREIPSSTAVIVNSVLPTKVHRSRMHSHNEWIKAEVESLGKVNVRYIDWMDSSWDNPFYHDGDMNEYLFDDDVHVSHWGLRMIWNCWCDSYPDLMYFPPCFSGELYRKKKGPDPVPTPVPSVITYTVNIGN